MIKYILEGVAVAIAAYYIPKRKVNIQEIAMIALSAAAVFWLLDTFAPNISKGARTGAGFGIGMQLGGIPSADIAAKAEADAEAMNNNNNNINGNNNGDDDVNDVVRTDADIYPGEYLGEHEALPYSVHCRGSNCYTKNSTCPQQNYPHEYLGQHDALPHSIHCRGSVCYTKPDLISRGL